MKKQYFKNWMKAACIRCIRTMAETAVSLLSTNQILGDVDWKFVCSATIFSGILTLLVSLTGLPEVKLQDTASNKNNS